MRADERERRYFFFFLLATAAWAAWVLAMRCWNLSTRPAVSTNFCCPVKNGWQALQMPTIITGLVERVLITLPQAQRISASTYFGCIFSFIRGRAKYHRQTGRQARFYPSRNGRNGRHPPSCPCSGRQVIH